MYGNEALMIGLEIKLVDPGGYMDTFAIFDRSGQRLRIWRREFPTGSEGAMFGLRIRPAWGRGRRKRGYQVEQVRYRPHGVSKLREQAHLHRVLRAWPISPGDRSGA